MKYIEILLLKEHFSEEQFLSLSLSLLQQDKRGKEKKRSFDAFVEPVPFLLQFGINEKYIRVLCKSIGHFARFFIKNMKKQQQRTQQK